MVNEAKQTEEPEVAAETGEDKQESNELKVVIILQGNRAMIGIKSTDCDPVFTTLEGDLAAALSQVPALVESANAKWDANPLNPKAEMPEPPPSAAPSRRQAAEPTPKKQPSFF